MRFSLLLHTPTCPCTGTHTYCGENIKLRDANHDFSLLQPYSYYGRSANGFHTMPIHSTIDIYHVWLNIYESSYGTTQIINVPLATRRYSHALYFCVRVCTYSHQPCASTRISHQHCVRVLTSSL